MKSEIKTRIVLVDILSAVLEQHRSLTPVLVEHLKNIEDPRDRSLIQFCSYGILREYFRLEAIIKKQVAKPLTDKEAHYLLLIGLYQLLYTRMPAFAVIHSTVDVAKKLKLFSVSGLINGVLRNFQRNQEAILTDIETQPIAHWSHPQWLMDELKSAWPTQWEEICTANNEAPPLWLRINTQKISPDAYVELLSKNNIAIAALEGSACCLAEPMDVKELPRFLEGWISVQDRSAQYAADLLDVKPGQRILDACAAPGGKAMHILEKEKNIEILVAIDNDEERIKKITENSVRLQIDPIKLILIHGDASTPEEWWDKQPFDRILLDAPCSATGVIRRHPDIKLLRKPTDIKALAKQQQALLKALWPLLKNEGILLYVTCSVLPKENESVVAEFCGTHPDAEAVKINTEWGMAMPHGRQILPGERSGQLSGDGFYYSVLRKNE